MQHQHMLICTYVSSLKKNYRLHEADETDSAYQFLLHRNEGDLFSHVLVYELVKVFVLLTRA